MSHKKTAKGKRRASALLLAVLICLSGFGTKAGAEKTEARVVRVPCGINDTLRLDEAGQPTGHCADYLDKLGRVNNWVYEYVETTWSEALEQLRRGEIDLLFPTSYSAARAEWMDFSTLPGGYTALGLFTRVDSGYSYEEFEAFDGARIGVTEGSANAATLEAFAGERGFSYEPVYIDTTWEKARALSQGEVDMILLGASNSVPDAALVAVLDATPFYYTVKKGDDGLLRELDGGMQQLLKNDAETVAETYRRSLMGDNNSILAFTEEEKTFAESGREIAVGFYKRNDPLAYPQEDGTYGGIYGDIIDYVRESSGLNLVMKPIDRQEDWQDLLRSGEIDFYIGASSVSARDPAFCTTETFFQYDSVLITQANCVFGALGSPVLALTYGRNYLSGNLPENIPVGEVRLYPSAHDCLVAVQKGEADGTVLNNIEYNYESKNPRFADLIQQESYRFSAQSGLVALTEVDQEMLSAVNSAVGRLPAEFVDSTIDSGLNLPYHISTADNLYIFRYLLIAVGLTLIAAVVVAVVIRRWRRRQRAVQLKIQERERHQLRILAALSRNYDSVYYVDLDADTSETVQLGDQARDGYGESAAHSFSAAFRWYVENRVLPECRDALLPLTEPAAILRRFQETPDFSVRYQVLPNERGQEYFEIHLVDVSENERERLMVFGTLCVDETVKAERAQRQLLQDALDAADRASRAKSDFLSKMSHDIRTPMNAIIGMTAIAAAHLDDPDRVRLTLGKITSSSRYLLGLINEVLDMSKIESGTFSLNEEAFNLSDLLNNLLIMVQPQIKEHGHDLEVHIQDIQHEDVLGDSLRIQQAFVNIMGNAVKYTPDGGRISLTVRELPMRSPKLAGYEFTFQDNGIGMSQEYLERIFEPFSRAEDVRVSRIQGTGLGMPITRSIVQQMNGSIKVESEEGKGSTFTVTIFLKLQDSQELDASELAELPVLVVDDDKDACESVCEMLEQIGMKSEGRNSGREGVEAVRQTMGTPEQFYAVILDWKMPEMDGVETARAIRKLTGDEIPIIILSAYDWSDIELEARAAGVDAFLSKPVFKSGLIRQFKSLKKKDGPKIQEDGELRAIQDCDYSGRRVLLVEDNDLNREIAREILEMAGLQVDEAENGKVAVDKVIASEKNYYDAIFMDIQMPIMSGYDATMAIRSLGRPDSRSIPIIAMTANAFVEDVQAAKAAGMNEHLAKPIDFDKLSLILKKYLD